MITPSDDPFHSFVPYPARMFPEREGALSGFSFAVKDLFDVEGYPTGFGQPHVLAHSGIRSQSAALVQQFLDQGAQFVGKTHLVEMAYALTGRNVHFGTPINPRAPDRLPGGSSSGSAAAVAGELADIGLGSDTLGSIRVPASYCGLYGLRPSHGRLSLQGARPLAPSLDTAGWMTRSGSLLVQLARIFLPGPIPKTLRLVCPRTLMQQCEPGVSEAFDAFLEKVQLAYGRVEEYAPDQSTIERWVETVRTIQGFEAWQAHGTLIESLHPELGPGIRERFAYAASMTPQAYRTAILERESFLQEFQSLRGDAVLILPSAPGPAPLRSASDDDLEVHRSALLRQLSLSSLFSRPEVSFPALSVRGLPVGVSLIGPTGGDLALCQLAERLIRL